MLTTVRTSIFFLYLTFFIFNEVDIISGQGELREVIVSHTDEKNILQLYRMRENGTNSLQITHSKNGCQMPSCSPNGKKISYTEQIDNGLALRISDINGENTRTLIHEGMNLMPSWLPDSVHIVWMKVRPSPKHDPATNSQLHIVNTKTGQSRLLFTDKEQLKFSNAMPSVSPRGDQIAFVSNRSGSMRVWTSDLDGTNARLASNPENDYHEKIKAPIEQKVPSWSPDGKWIAHWEGVEMIHMSKFTGKNDPQRDQMIASTFHVWVVSRDGKKRKRFGKGDDPTWSPDGFVTRAFPDPKRGGPKVMIDTGAGQKELTIVPRKRNWGRFAWIPK